MIKMLRERFFLPEAAARLENIRTQTQQKFDALLFFGLSRAEVFIVACAALINFIQIFGTNIFYQPDSGSYLIGAYQIFHKFDFSAVSLNRTPGYQIMIAPIIGLLGNHCVLGIKLLQHGMLIFIPLFINRIVKLLTQSPIFAFACAFLSCFNLQLQSYGHLPMSEVSYSFALTLGVLLTLRFLTEGRHSLFYGVCLVFAWTSYIRPNGLLLVCIAIGIYFLRVIAREKWDWLWAGIPKARRRTYSYLKGFLGVMLFIGVLLPWLTYNYKTYGYFSMTRNFGLALYSNVIEYAGLRNPKNVYLNDIKDKWNQYQDKRVRDGRGPETTYSWYNHFPSWGAYREITGLGFGEADAIYEKAAKEGIRLEPKAYLRHCLDGIKRLLISYEPTYLYLPSISEEQSKNKFYQYALDIHKSANSFYATYDWALKDQLVIYEKENWLTPIYMGLVNFYHPFVAVNRNIAIFFPWFVFGIICGVLSIGGKRGMLWGYLMAVLFYQVVVTMLLVPWTPRHRLAIDPLLGIFYFYGFYFVLCHAWNFLNRRILKNKEGVL